MNRRFGNVFSKLFLLYAALFAGSVYAMLIEEINQSDAIKRQNEVIERVETRDQRFIRKFSCITFAKAQEKFYGYPVNDQNRIVREVSNKDAVFMVVFNMATKLSVDMQKMVVNKLLHNNIQAVEKFVNMPICRAVEWYALSKKLSRGKLIYLPVFKNRFDKKGLLFRSSGDLSFIRQDCGQKKLFFHPEWGSEIQVALLDTANSLSGLRYIKQDDFNQNAFLEDGDLEKFLDEIASCFFQLSKQDIMLLMNFFERRERIPFEQLKQLLAIDKKVPFFDGDRDSRVLYYRKNYSSSDVGDFIKVGAHNGMKYVFPVVLAPFCLAGLSQLIESQCCQKIVSGRIVQDNIIIKKALDRLDILEKYSSIYSLSELNDVRAWYTSELLNPMVYSLTDICKMSIPLLLPIPAVTHFFRKFGVSDWLYRGVVSGCIVSLGTSWLSSRISFQNSSSCAAVVGAVSLFSILAGIAHNLCSEYFSYESRVNGMVQWKDVNALFKSEK